MEPIKLSVDEFHYVIKRLPKKEHKFTRLKYAVAIPILKKHDDILGYYYKDLFFKLNTKLEWQSLQKIEIE